MKYLIPFLLAAATLTTCGPQQTQNSSPVAPASTQGRVNVPGTRLFVVPPPGFHVSTSFTGLERDEQTAIQITDLVGGSFYTNAATFDRAGFEAQGAQVLDYRDTTINNFPAKYVCVQGSASSKSYGLAFGDSTFCVLAFSLVPLEESAASVQKIKQALFTMTYDKALKVDPFATAPFTLDDRNAKFKFFKFTGNMYMYMPDTTAHKAADNAPMVTVVALPKDPAMDLPGLAALMVSTLEKYGLTDAEVRHQTPVQVSGQPGIESEVYGTMKGKKALFYQLILLNADHSFLVQGVIPEQLPASLRDVREFAHTIRLK